MLFHIFGELGLAQKNKFAVKPERIENKGLLASILEADTNIKFYICYTMCFLCIADVFYEVCGETYIITNYIFICNFFVCFKLTPI